MFNLAAKVHKLPLSRRKILRLDGNSVFFYFCHRYYDYRYEKDIYFPNHNAAVCGGFGADGECDVYGARRKQPVYSLESCGCQQPHPGMAGDALLTRYRTGDDGSDGHRGCRDVS